ncbi:YhgE/Pip family protein [Terracoccus luteus]|uniref:Putative membrane protein n=1 Tax=Terracoccus luteus TaxID=53356 RepID=A0A839PX12_9MICO|nr:YhgE/Pip domain-containing protein [Terracoccus luteus]MBB2985332.1 putative membrane protein [Terracoccus luteus]MCP2170984.1 putative membrane protein [Terracoccus luteus]
MNPFRLAVAELRRLTANRLAALAVVALTIVPTLYGGLYLWANHDPYGQLPNVPAAVATDDVGTTLSTGERLRVGDRVADDLVRSHSFDWHRVSRQEALDGVEQGRYSFALVLPRTFSSDLASSGDFHPRRASMTLETNDANNYLASVMGNTVVKEVTTSVASQVSSTAASQLLVGLSQVHDELGKAADGAGRLRAGATDASKGAASLVTGSQRLTTGLTDLRDGATRLAAGADDAVAGADRLHTGASQLRTGLRTLSSKTAALPAQTDRLADGAEQVAAGNRTAAAAGREVAGVSTTLRGDLAEQRSALLADLRTAGLTDEQLALVTTRLDRVDATVGRADGRIQTASRQLTALSTGADEVATGARTLARSTPALVSGVDGAATGATRLRDGAASLETGLRTLGTGADRLAAGAGTAVTSSTDLTSGARRLQSGVAELGKGAGTLATSLTQGRDQVPDPTDAQRRAVAQTIGSPVTVDTSSMSSAGSYGAGLAPLFLSLALWIGAYVLFLVVRPLSPRALATSQRSVRTALGGWLAPVAVGAVQAVVLYLVVAVGLRIHVAHPVLTMLFLLAVSMTFVAVLHALAARLGAIGKFLGLVLMVVQLVSAGGTFPWQTLPEPLQWVHHVAPMSYAVDGLRRLLYGADLGPVLLDLGVLAAFLVAALALSSVAARRARVWTAARVHPELVL